jgi:hypothetical protein
MVSLDQKPRVDAQHHLTVCSRTTDPGDQLTDKTPCPTGGVRRALAHPRVAHLTGVGARRQEWVITEHLRVAIAGTLFLLPRHGTDRRVEIQDQPSGRTYSHRPGTTEALTDHRVELADVSEAKGTEKGPKRRWRHHPVGQHGTCRSGAQHVGVIDVARSGDDGMDECAHLTTGQRTTDPSDKVQLLIDQLFEAETANQRCDEEKTGICHQVRFIKGHTDPVQTARY